MVSYFLLPKGLVISLKVSYVTSSGIRMTKRKKFTMLSGVIFLKKNIGVDWDLELLGIQMKQC